jgi:hypothetical protein
MKSDMITCSFVMDRKVYNTFKSIVSKQGQNVKGNIVRYMQSVIQYDTPNADTILAIREAEDLKKNPNKKVYNSFSEVLEELESDE